MITVIYIDDEPDLCEIFSDLYGDTEISIQTFTDPHVGLKAINESKPDVIFLDLRIPGMSGDELASKITHSAPIYLMTGDLQPNLKFKFEGILPKPFNDEKIRAAINSAKGSKKKAA